MKRFYSIAIGVALVAAMLFTGCTTAATNVAPPITFTPTNGVLELSVGTVNFAGGATGLNVLETFRSPNGLTAIPINTATVAGPGGFAGPAGSADPGHGAALVTLGAANNSFSEGANGGIITDSADGFGIGPPGSSGPFPNSYPLQPQFLDGVAGAGAAYTANCTGAPPPLCQQRDYGMPPAYPTTGGIRASGAGYPEGFYLLALTAAPPTGTYTLTVSFSQNGATSTNTKTASLGSNVPLAVIAAPGYVSNGAGGGTVSVVLPVGVTEALVNIFDITASGRHSTAATVLFRSSGSAPVPSGTFGTGDSLSLQAIGFDYDDFGLGPPGNMSQTPTFPAQADVTVSLQTSATE